MLEDLAVVENFVVDAFNMFEDVSFTVAPSLGNVEVSSSAKDRLLLTCNADAEIF